MHASSTCIIRIPSSFAPPSFLPSQQNRLAASTPNHGAIAVPLESASVKAESWNQILRPSHHGDSTAEGDGGGVDDGESVIGFSTSNCLPSGANTSCTLFERAWDTGKCNAGGVATTSNPAYTARAAGWRMATEISEKDLLRFPNVKLQHRTVSCRRGREEAHVSDVERFYTIQREKHSEPQLLTPYSTKTWPESFCQAGTGSCKRPSNKLVSSKEMVPRLRLW